MKPKYPVVCKRVPQPGSNRVVFKRQNARGYVVPLPSDSDAFDKASVCQVLLDVSMQNNPTACSGWTEAVSV